MIADELRRQADVFTDLVELQSRLGPPVELAGRPQSGSVRGAAAPARPKSPGIGLRRAAPSHSGRLSQIAARIPLAERSTLSA
jgi:hypothetical protein